MRRGPTRSLPFVLGALSLFALPLPAADWPQWRGVNRDGHSPETGLLTKFPAGGPKLLWTFREAGEGFSSVAVVGDTLYSLGADGSRKQGYKEFVFAVNVKDGSLKWKTPLASYSDKVIISGWGNGPRSTPAVAGDRVAVLGANGDLAVLDTAGKVVWQQDAEKGGAAFGGPKGSPAGWGFSESPLIDNGWVVWTPGGPKGAVAALGLNDGYPVWRSTGNTTKAAYSSLVPATLAGVRQYVQLTADGLLSVKPEDGTVLWTAPVAGNGIATIPTPVVMNDLVFATSAYGTGCGCVEVTAQGDKLAANVLYELKEMANHHGGVIRFDGAVYGSSGNTPGLAKFFCQDVRTGKVHWQLNRKLDHSALVAADGHIYAYGQKTGTVVCLKHNLEKFEETGRFTIPETTKLDRRQGLIWNHPVIADGKLYLRDNDLLFCFDLKPAS